MPLVLVPALEEPTNDNRATIEQVDGNRHIASNGIPNHKVGRFCMTPEFPDGTYAYFLTKEWPVIPRAFRGRPVKLR